MNIVNFFSKKKRRQHYVWRYYLKSWASNNKLYCLCNGKIFKVNLMGVATKRDFYRLNRLTENDIRILKSIIDNSPEHLRKLHVDLVNKFNFIFKFKDFLESEYLNDETIDHMIEVAINNFEEEYQSMLEVNSIRYIEAILQGNIEFYTSEHDCMRFLYFLFTQYFRTNKIKSNLISVFENNSNIDIEKIWNVLSHILATNAASSLFTRRSEYKMALLENKTDFSLITGDQAVINTYGTDTNLNEPVSAVEIYYPISPTLAILISNDNKYAKYNKFQVDKDEVISFNNHIFKGYHEQLYSDSKDVLEEYLFLYSDGIHLTVASNEVV